MVCAQQLQMSYGLMLGSMSETSKNEAPTNILYIFKLVNYTEQKADNGKDSIYLNPWTRNIYRPGLFSLSKYFA